ncbi:PLP-dependent aminotransferase family protein [Dokdonella sp.]|uniref:aminotransferase-like domain-containing protein n=1 Tax=Dokdonella sp. TaxID=2291710 RepID=UPI002F3EFA56
MLYEDLAGRLGAQIRRGLLRPGERLPSLRRLGRQEKVSIATAVEAYLRLEREGLVEARERSGYFVRARAVPPPQARLPRVQSRAPQTLRNPALLGVLDVLSREDLLPLHVTTPAAELLPGRALAAATARTLRRDPGLALAYGAPQGLLQLREQIARRYLGCGVEVDPAEVVITAGAMEAISLALRCVTRAGDVVLLETPTYYGILQAVAALGLRAIEVPSRGSAGIDAAAVRTALERHPVRAAVLVPNFNNPNGSLTGDDDKRAIVAACGERGVVVIEDDLYGELAYSGERPAPLRRYAGRARVITCSSWSKTLAPGLRVGWALAGDHVDDIVRAKCFSSVATASLPQRAIGEYFARHDFDRSLRRLRRELATNAQRWRDAIRRSWPDGTRVSEPAGGVSLWLELAGGVDGQALFEAAMAHGIGCLPGHLFSLRGDYRGHLRLGLGLAWNARVEDGLRELGRLAGRLA